jgi:hypothetical protein
MENKLTKLIEPELKAFNAITKGCESVLKKAGVADKMVLALVSDKAPAVLVGVSDKISRKQFINTIRDLLITYCNADSDKITDMLVDVVDEFEKPSVMMKLK